jgi:transposase-like protein
MPRTCTICAHEKRQEIDRAIVAGGSIRAIAGRFGTSRMALQRHKESHLPATLAEAHEAEEVARADTLLDQVNDLQAKTLAILQKAERAGDLRTAATAIGQARQNLELLGKLAGELRPDTQVNVLVTSPAWVEVRSKLLRALEPYPEAKQAVLAAVAEEQVHG